MAKIRLITFDLDDTLWPCHSVIQKAEQASWDWLSQHTPKLTENYDLMRLRQHRMGYVQENPQIAHDMTLVRQGALAQLMAQHDYPESCAQTAQDIFRQHRNRVAPYPDVLPALSQLKQHYILVSITNGNAEIANTPLKDCFHRSFTAAEVGAARPDPALFKAALTFAQVAPDEALHVGDDPVRDIMPAQALGMHTAWMKRNAQQNPDVLITADMQFENLTQLLDKLNN